MRSCVRCGSRFLYRDEDEAWACVLCGCHDYGQVVRVEPLGATWQRLKLGVGFCRVCERERPLAEFSHSQLARNTWRLTCRECERNNAKARYWASKAAQEGGA